MNDDQMRKRGLTLVSLVAKATGKSPATIYRWIHAGHITGVKSGQIWFVREKEVRRYAGLP